MRKVGRIVWWKCVLWTVLGGVLGVGAAALMPEPGPPLGAKRLPASSFVMIATSPRVITGQSIDAIKLYPARVGVRLVTFALHQSDGSSTTTYAYANEPFVTAREFESIRDVARRYIFTKPGSAVLAGAADVAMKAAADQPGQHWASIAAFLDQSKTAHPELTYQTLQWLTPQERERNGAIIGALALGVLGSLAFARRSEADRLAAELLLNAKATESKPTVPAGPSAEDLQRVAELDALLTQSLTSGAGDAGTKIIPPQERDGVTQPATIAALRTEEVAPVAETPEEKKDYAGEFYPTVRAPKRNGFSLVELLVTIGVIAILIAILLPTLLRTRRTADTIACAANLHSIGLGMQMYLQANLNTFPAAYLYIGHKIENGIQTPTSPSAGYIHWSSYLYGEGTTPAAAFRCPAMTNGGLPPTNTPPNNRDPGQNCPSETVVDQQAPRLAYTVNEVLCPRNKFVAPIQSAVRIYRFVKANEVRNSAGTILGTEMIDDAMAVSYDDVNNGWIMSHRPIHGFCGLDGELDMYLIPPGAGFRRITRADLDADPMTAKTTATRLDLVGRNHGPRQGYPDVRLSNFLYVDGHVESKSVYDTLQPFEWGEEFYSLVPNNDLQQ